MSEFLYLYRGGMSSGSPQGSPEQMQQQMQKWIAWMKELEQQGHMRNPGHPLERSGKTVKGREKIVTDGPYAEAKDVVGGYTLIEARDLAHAVELSRGCPILGVDGTVEVRPIMKIGA
jgi:hypothetical protein